MPFAMPQAPFCLSGAEQLAVVPPLTPEQVQLKGPEPVTLEELPIVQKPVVGAVYPAVPFAVPQAPFCISSAEQLASEPP